MLHQVSRPDIMARYDWLVDFGLSALRHHHGISSLLPREGFTDIPLRPVITDDLPVGVSFGIVNTSTVFLLDAGVPYQPKLAVHTKPNKYGQRQDINLMGAT